MLSDFYIYHLAIAVGLALFWSCPADAPVVRQRVLIVVSAVTVLLYTPGGFVACLYLALVPLVGQALFQRGKSVPLFWGFIALSLVPMVSTRLLGDFGLVVTFGIAFATVKSLGMIFTAYNGRERVSPSECFLLIFFFPLFTIGPVERLSTFARDRLTVSFDSGLFWHGCGRIMLGFFLIMFVCNNVIAPMRDVWLGNGIEQIRQMDRIDALALVYVSFAFTYLNFVGFSEVAIGTSALFGLRVIENFNRPLLARNLSDFWKRYHISMGNWINQFLFFPLAVFFRKSWGMYAATVIAFVLFGLWHEFTVKYLVWGLANGAGVVLVNYLRQSRMIPDTAGPGVLRHVRHGFGIVLTITFISWIQTFANLDDLSTSMAMTRALVGL